MKYSTLLKIVQAFLFLIAAVCFTYFINFLVDNVTSQMRYMFTFLPHFLGMLMPTYILFVLHLIIHPASFKRKKLTYMVNGPVIMGLALIIMILDCVFVANGTYHSFLHGSVTRIYPLDNFLFAIIELCAGGLLLFRGLTFKENNEDVYQLLAKKRPNRVVRSIARGLYALVLLYFVGQLCLVPMTLDTRMTYFGASLSVYILMAAPIVPLVLYELVYRNKEEGAAKHLLVSRFVLISLGISSIGAIWFLIAKIVSPNFISHSLVTIFPIDYVSSINVGPILLILLNFVPPVVAIIHFLHPEKDKKEIKEIVDKVNTELNQ